MSPEPAPSDETVVIPVASAIRPPSSTGLSRLSITSVSEDEGRFLPGTLVAGRYRIIGLLGRGGMGEVYRATDLTLGQSVALKFLPDHAAGNERLLERFHNEVRTARQVSHPNVCRVYDIGEADGLPFISMEYVDGEDLASLLQRIGRLPSDKAMEMTRKLCAGLAAAHERGIIHRDLKPHNVMLNKRGGVVIMDFGLAAIADQLEGAETRSGTPAYMAPEQLRGDAVTAKSDLYSLGLIIYELFTGKRAFEANSAAELLRAQESSRPASITSLAADADPSVEKVVQRCLHPDPGHRPPTALAIAAALPGGDPLQAALAAGEMPSPEMVAAAGATCGLRLWFMAPAVGFCLIGVLAWPFLKQPTSLLAHAPVQMSPPVLERKAREIAAQFTDRANPAAWSSGWNINNDLTAWFNHHPREGKSWDQIYAAESPVQWFYRQSPRYFLSPPDGKITFDRPPLTVPGMVNMIITSQGQLRYYRAVAPREDDRGQVSSPVDPAAVFKQAGLDIAKFQEATPNIAIPLAFDARRAWTGQHPDLPNVPIRIEMATWKGSLAGFEVRWPWTQPINTSPQVTRLGNLYPLFLRFIGVCFVIFFAYKNIRSGRGDRVGAFRVALAAFLLHVGSWAFRLEISPSGDVVDYVTQELFYALGFGLILWAGYVAMEPAVRARWPQSQITWNRLLQGQWTDPQVGSHLLIGVVLGMALRYIFLWRSSALVSKGRSPGDLDLSGILSTRALFDQTGGVLFNALQTGLIIFFVLCGVRFIARRDWAAALVASLVLAFQEDGVRNSTNILIDVPVFLAIYFGICFVLLRMGLIPAIVCVIVVNLMGKVPVGSEFFAWYNSFAVAYLGIIGSLAIYGFWRSQSQTAPNPLGIQSATTGRSI